MLTSTACVYQWERIGSDQPMATLSRKRIIGERAMISRVTLEKGCDVPTHVHENEQFACVMSGRVRFGIGAESARDRYEFTLGPNEVLHLPAGVPHSAFAEEESLVLDIFSPPSEKTGIDR